MNKKKYERYINYIVNDIEKPYFYNMVEMYGLRPEEFEFVLSRLYNQPVTIKGKDVYDTNGNIIYTEGRTNFNEYVDGYWHKREYDQNGNMIYFENSYGYWHKREYDSNNNKIYDGDSNGGWYKQEFDQYGNKIYFETSNDYWEKSEYDQYGNEIYYENSDGVIRDYRYE